MSHQRMTPATPLNKSNVWPRHLSRRLVTITIPKLRCLTHRTAKCGMSHLKVTPLVTPLCASGLLPRTVSNSSKSQIICSFTLYHYIFLSKFAIVIPLLLPYPMLRPCLRGLVDVFDLSATVDTTGRQQNPDPADLLGDGHGTYSKSPAGSPYLTLETWQHLLP
jgi:hypothetical protein